MSILGQPIDRIDGRRKVTGTARYAAEFAIPGVVYAVMVESTIGAGQITGFDLSEAGGMPGVIRIITPANAIRLAMPNDNSPGAHPPPLQDMTVLYNGQPVAVVVADTLDRAIAGAAKVHIHYKPGEPVTRMESVLDQAYVPKHFRNGTRPPDSLRGDPETAFATAAARIEATYVTPIENHNPMEPHATIGHWDGAAGRQRLTVWHTTQGVSGTQATLAALFSLDPADVRVICPFGGGGFGCKGRT